MTKTVFEKITRPRREAGCKAIAEVVGMSCCIGADGWDQAIVDLAEQCFFDKLDIVNRPSRVASVITEMLEEMAKNP